MTEQFDDGPVEAALTTGWLGRPCHFFPEIDSTNERLKQMAFRDAGESAPAGTMILADFQTRGKGRQQRRWLAPRRSSLLLSLLFRPDWPAEQANWLTMLTSTAAAVAIETETGLPVAIKWPNDLVIADSSPGETGWRKVGGILLESKLVDGRLQSAVVGLGINVNIAAEDLPPAAFPATSLMIELGRPLARLPLLVAILSELEQRYDAVGQPPEGQSPQPAWNRRLITLGQAVRVSGVGDQDGQSWEGIATGTDAWGRLLVRQADGTVQTVAAGDVTLRR